MRAFFVSASLICRDRQLASSVVIQGICVVLCGLTYAWRNRRRREGGVSRDGQGCHRCHTSQQRSGGAEKLKGSPQVDNHIFFSFFDFVTVFDENFVSK